MTTLVIDVVMMIQTFLGLFIYFTFTVLLSLFRDDTFEEQIVEFYFFRSTDCI